VQTSVWGGSAKQAIAAAALVAAFTVATVIGASRSLTHIGAPPRLISTGPYSGDLLLVLVALLPVAALIATRAQRRTSTARAAR
jgi:hypothetical protein